MTRNRTYYRLQGVAPRENRPNQQTTLMVLLTDLPLLGFHLLTVLTTTRLRGLRPESRHAWNLRNPLPDS